jgi:hypothetical protein
VADTMREAVVFALSSFGYHRDRHLQAGHADRHLCPLSGREPLLPFVAVNRSKNVEPTLLE